MSEPRLIDGLHLGTPKVIGCWQVGATLIDPGPATCLLALLEALDRPPQRILLTHIHLDHAGATGSLCQRFGGLEVYVHERGAPHLVDPSRLLASAERLYGDDMCRLWGEVVAVDDARVHAVRGGERLDDGFEVAYTPGHASHHVSYRRGDTVFAGDVAGVRVPPCAYAIPPTPPPDIDIAAWERSLELVAAWQPRRLAITHFGEVVDDIPGHLAQVGHRLRAWAALAAGTDQQGFVEAVRREQRREAGELEPAYRQAAPPEQLYLGLERALEHHGPPGAA